MARSEVFNTDCIEYMRSLPSKYFDLAVCDPPFGKGNDDTLDVGGARFGERFSRYYKLEPTQRRMEREVLQPSETGGQNGSEKDSKGISSRNRFQGGTWATRYRVPIGGGVLN